MHRSAGASLRRYNETALMTEIRDLMTSWSAYTEEASCIFIRVPKHSKGVLIGNRGDKAPFLRGDPRLRDIPFPTRRPTFKEVQATHTRLATVYVGVVRAEVILHTRGERGRGCGDMQSKRKGGRRMEGEGERREGEGKSLEAEGKRREGEERVDTRGGDAVQLTDLSTRDLDVLSLEATDLRMLSGEAGKNNSLDATDSQVVSGEVGKSKKRRKNKKKVVQASADPGE